MACLAELQKKKSNSFIFHWALHANDAAKLPGILNKTKTKRLLKQCLRSYLAIGKHWPIVVTPEEKERKRKEKKKKKQRTRDVQKAHFDFILILHLQ